MEDRDYDPALPASLRKRHRKQRIDAVDHAEVISCKVCGLRQRRDKFPPMNVQHGRQYYRTLCAKCVYQRAKTYKKDPSKTAKALAERGLGKPGRPKQVVKSCLTCGLTMKTELFPRTGKGRYSAYCQPCKNERQRGDYARRKAREKQRDTPNKVNFNNLLSAFRPTS